MSEQTSFIVAGSFVSRWYGVEPACLASSQVHQLSAVLPSNVALASCPTTPDVQVAIPFGASAATLVAVAAAITATWSSAVGELSAPTLRASASSEGDGRSAGAGWPAGSPPVVADARVPDHGLVPATRSDTTALSRLAAVDEQARDHAKASKAGRNGPRRPNRLESPHRLVGGLPARAAAGRGRDPGALPDRPGRRRQDQHPAAPAQRDRRGVQDRRPPVAAGGARGAAREGAIGLRPAPV
jgi:hypothetical protein